MCATVVCNSHAVTWSVEENWVNYLDAFFSQIVDDVMSSWGPLRRTNEKYH